MEVFAEKRRAGRGKAWRGEQAGGGEFGLERGGLGGGGTLASPRANTWKLGTFHAAVAAVETTQQGGEMMRAET